MREVLAHKVAVRYADEIAADAASAGLHPGYVVNYTPPNVRQRIGKYGKLMREQRRLIIKTFELAQSGREFHEICSYAQEAHSDLSRVGIRITDNRGELISLLEQQFQCGDTGIDWLREGKVYLISSWADV